MIYNIPVMDGELGPYGFARSEYFRQQHQVNVERRLRAAAGVRILESNLALELQKLARLQASAGHLPEAVSDGPGGASEHLTKSLAEQSWHIEDLEKELIRQRRAMSVSHADRLAEWAVEQRDRRLPEPGEIMLARRSKKPWRQDSIR